MLREHLADGVRVRRSAVDELAWLSIDLGTYTRRRAKGLEIDGTFYVLDLPYASDAPGNNPAAERTFRIGKHDDIDEFVEVFNADCTRWYGTAFADEHAPPEAHQAIHAGRHRRIRTYEAAMGEGQRRRTIRAGDVTVSPVGPVPKNDRGEDIDPTEQPAPTAPTPEDVPADAGDGPATSGKAPSQTDQERVAARLEAARARRHADANAQERS